MAIVTGLKLYVVGLSPAQLREPVSSQTVARNPLYDARVVAASAMTQAKGQLWTSWAASSASAAHGLALGEEPGGLLADAIYGAIWVSLPQVDAAGPFSVPDRTISTLFSTFHGDLQPAPVRRSGVILMGGISLLYANGG